MRSYVNVGDADKKDGLLHDIITGIATYFVEVIKPLLYAVII